MKGEVEINQTNGEISSTLALSNEQTNELGQVITNILQDVNSYMRMNGGQMGDLRKTTLLLGNLGHEVRIVVGQDTIKAIVRPAAAGSAKE
jgi:hypothetical protein